MRFLYIECGAYWTNWWAWQALESTRGGMEDDWIMVLEREARHGDLDTSNGFEVCAVILRTSSGHALTSWGHCVLKLLQSAQPM